MLPIFVGIAFWIVLCAAVILVVFISSRRLRPFAGFVFLTPALGILCACAGFAALGWFLDERLRPEIATSVAFYLGFPLCGAVGSAIGFGIGFVLWKRLRASQPN